jgi:hypothetical protein
MMLRIRGAARTAALATDELSRATSGASAGFSRATTSVGSRRHGVTDRAVSWSGDVHRPGRTILGPVRSRRGSSMRCCATCAARGAARVGELLPPTGSDTTAAVSRRRSCIWRRRRVEACCIPRGYRRTSDEPPPRAHRPSRGPARPRRTPRSTRRVSRRGRGGDVVTRAKRVGLCGQTSRSAAGSASSALQCCQGG